jgi:hypothetical protein
MRSENLMVTGNPARVVEKNVRTGHYGVRRVPDVAGKNMQFTQF